MHLLHQSCPLRNKIYQHTAKTHFLPLMFSTLTSTVLQHTPGNLYHVPQITITPLHLSCNQSPHKVDMMELPSTHLYTGDDQTPLLDTGPLSTFLILILALPPFTLFSLLYPLFLPELHLCIFQAVHNQD